MSFLNKILHFFSKKISQLLQKKFENLILFLRFSSIFDLKNCIFRKLFKNSSLHLLYICQDTRNF